MAVTDLCVHGLLSLFLFSFVGSVEIDIISELRNIKDTLKIHESKNNLHQMRISELEGTVKLQNKEIDRLNNIIRQLQIEDAVNSDDKLHVPVNKTESKSSFSEKDGLITKKLDSGGIQRNSEIVKDKRLLIDNIPVQQSAVAFYAYMTKSELNIGRQHALVFNTVITNFGNSYSKHTGVFTAPNNGIYVFTFTLFPDRGTSTGVNLYRNSDIIGKIWTDMSGNGVFSGTTPVVVVSMTIGDTAYVRTSATIDSVGNIFTDQNVRTSFAGWKIAEI